MLHTLERALEDIVVIVTWEAGFDVFSDSDACARHIKAELDAALEPVFVIIDMHLHDVDLDILLRTANIVVDGDPLRHHVNLKQMVIVYNGDLRQLHITPREDQAVPLPPLRLFPSREDALIYVRTAIL